MSSLSNHCEEKQNDEKKLDALFDEFGLEPESFEQVETFLSVCRLGTKERIK